MTLVTRKATTSDVDLVVSSRLAFLRQVRRHDFDESSNLETDTRSFIVAETGQRRLRTWIAEEAEQFAGIVSLLLWPRPPRPEHSRVFDGCIINMFVPPDRQHQGIGRRLLDQCLGSAAELGIGKFVLHTTDEGHHLYEATGFTPTQNWMQLAVTDADTRNGERRT